MNPEDWRQVEHLFHQALACPEDERSHFVKQEAHSNELVKDEVLRLLDCHDQASCEKAWQPWTQTLPGTHEISEKIWNHAKQMVADAPTLLRDDLADDAGNQLSEELDPLASKPSDESAESPWNDRVWSTWLAQRLEPHFKILGVMARGGMGVVLKAFDCQLSRLVAIKVISSPWAEKKVVERFLRESKLAAQATSDHIVTIYSVSYERGVPFISMEWIEGPTLKELIQQQRTLEPRLAAELTRQAACGLADAQDQGLIHRDIKPANLMLCAKEQLSDGCPYRVKIIDFGLARELHAEQTTNQLGVAGTPSYMSPEQVFNPQRVDERSDIYSLGATLYHMLSGKPSFQGTNHDVVHQIKFKRPVPLRQGDQSIPKDLETICLKAMAKDPQQRYASASEFASDLRRFLDNQAIQARSVSLLERGWLWISRHRLHAMAWGWLMMTLGTVILGLVGGTVAIASLLGFTLVAGVIGTTWGMIRAAMRSKSERLALQRMSQEANRYAEGEQHDQAQRLYEETYRQQKLKLGESHPDTLSTMNGLADAYMMSGLNGSTNLVIAARKALPLLIRVLKLRKRHHGSCHPATLTSMNDLARAYKYSNCYEEALPIYEKTLELRRQHMGNYHSDTITSINNLAVFYRTISRLDEACTLMDETVKRRKEMKDMDRKGTKILLANLGATYLKMGRLAEATVHLEEAWLALKQEHLFWLRLPQRLIEAYGRANQLAKLKELLEECCIAYPFVFKVGSLKIADALEPLAAAILPWQRFEEAEKILRDCLEIRLRSGTINWQRDRTKALLGIALGGQKRWKDAEPFLMSGYAGIKDKYEIIPREFRDELLIATAESLGQMSQEMGRSENLEKWQQECRQYRELQDQPVQAVISNQLRELMMTP